jgi:hypothetical protein
MEIIDGDIDYAFYLTINEVLELVVVHCERARDAENDIAMELNVKMASRAMRSALEIIGCRKRGKYD